MKKKVSDIIEKCSVFATPRTTISLAAIKIIRSMKNRIAVVNNKHNLIGIYTPIDIISKYYEKRSKSITVSEFMKKEVVYGLMDEDILNILYKMRMFSIGGLPIADEQGKVVGIIEKKDIIPLLQFDDTMVAKDIMTANPLFVRDIRSDDALNVLRVFSKTKFKRFPIVDEERRVIGLLHVSTLLKMLVDVDFDWDKFISLDANLFISSNYISVKEDEPLRNIIRYMKEKTSDTTIVVNDENKLVGIITYSDILYKATLV